MTAPRVGVRWASEHPSWSLFLGFALIFLMLIPPGVIVIDGISTFSTADAIAKGHLYVPCAVSGYDALPGIAANKAAVIGRGGHCYSIWFPLISFLGAPLAGIGELLGKLAGVRGENVAELFALIVPA